jgi:hypothetical protein
METELAPGMLLARGVCRHLRSRDFVPMTEFVPERGLRVDVIALGPRGEVWIVECKSSRADFMADAKWQGYLPFCDRFFWAVDAAFPQELLPDDCGLILADGFDAEIQRFGPEAKLAGPTRQRLIRKFARNAGDRLRLFIDPGPARALAARRSDEES